MLQCSTIFGSILIKTEVSCVLTRSRGIVPESMAEIAMEPGVAAENTPDHLLVEVDSPSTASLHSGSEGSLNESQVLVQVVRFVFTANTLTYAVAGEVACLELFREFSGAHLWLRSSRLLGLRSSCRISFAMSLWVQGSTVYWQCPKFVTLTPEVAASGTQFVDVAPHRESILLPYKTYFTSSDDLYRDLSIEEEDFQLAAGNLFSTGLVYEPRGCHASCGSLSSSDHVCIEPDCIRRRFHSTFP